MENDPQEFFDLGASPDHQDVITLMYDRLAQWARRAAQRVTMSDDDIASMRGQAMRQGILLGVFTQDEVADDLSVRYRGRVPE